MIKSINTKNAPEAIGPYSQAMAVGELIFCSGQIGIDPKTNNFATGIESQTTQTLQNLQEVLMSAGSNINNVLKTTVYLKNMSDFAKMNEIYARFFGKHKPARATVEVARLPKDVLVEIDAIAIAQKICCNKDGKCCKDKSNIKYQKSKIKMTNQN